MEMASFSGILKTIFYILAFYYIFKFLARLLLPIMVKKVVEKAGENYQRQYQSNYNSNTNHQQDEFVTSTSKSNKPRETKKVGEYIDYEELD
jgi:hypothetical protein